MIPPAQNDLEQRDEKSRSSMSLKFAALSSLTVLSAFGTPARADDEAEDLGRVRPQEPTPTAVSRRSSVAEPENPEAGGAASPQQENR